MFAPKLKKGDGVRIIAPARSLMLPWINDELKTIAQKRLEDIGLRVTFGKYVNELDDFDSSSIEHRIEDLRSAFLDDSVQLVLTAIGGFNSNQLLGSINYEFIKAHPKILCGFSDITALATAIFAKTGLVTYSGPHFFNFGQMKNFDYSLNYFHQCFFQDSVIDIQSSKEYVDDLWATKQSDVLLRANPGWTVMQEGKSDGMILGGNLGTLHLLQGTEFMPVIDDDVILFLEDDSEDHPAAFDRHLQSFLHQPLTKHIRGVVIGRCEEKSGITTEIMRKIISSKKELVGIPVIYGVDFGHTTPMITFPIGGRANIFAATGSVSINILQH